jgi:hypothetical protein
VRLQTLAGKKEKEAHMKKATSTTVESKLAEEETIT